MNESASSVSSFFGSIGGFGSLICPPSLAAQQQPFIGAAIAASAQQATMAEMMAQRIQGRVLEESRVIPAQQQPPHRKHVESRVVDDDFPQSTHLLCGGSVEE